MNRIVVSLITLVSIFSSCSTGDSVSRFSTCSEGRSLAIDFLTPGIVRIQYADGDNFVDNNTGVVVLDRNNIIQVSKETDGDVERLISSELIVEYNKNVNALTFIDSQSGKVLFKTSKRNTFEVERVAQVNVTYDEASARVEHTANGDVTIKDEVGRDTVGFINKYRFNFDFQDGEALYGLGAHMEDYMNLRGKTMYLTQHNLKAMVPVLNSTAGYGLLFDAGCGMLFDDKDDNSFMELEAADELDVYFMKGEKLDNVVAQYRYLTGGCPMMPRYMFGYIQSKERYASQQEVINTLKIYRNFQVPIDMIVQDWNYWPEGWGYMKMDPKYYPDPKAMADSVHALNAKLMVSIWPNPQYCPQEKDFSERGFMLKQSVYDVFNPEARDYYWSYANNEFFSKGFDAWWCDCSEPLDGDWKNMGEGYGWNNHKERWLSNMEALSISLGEKRSSLYSLYHAMGIYENQRKTTSEKRVVNLTRSSYAGQQRYATITWNGDTHASWKSFKQQIPAGLNFMATGCPYWSVDIGSFFTRGNDPWNRWFYAGQFPEGCQDPAYREYYTRMLQWGTFLPMMRSHGTDTPREIWRFGEPGTVYYDAILEMIRLRYTLLPYIYSYAWKITNENYTMARMLAFDFAYDPRVLDIKDEYMFGDALLVCPVTEPNATSRTVYLPKGCQWYDFWTEELYEGGQDINVDAPIDRIPLFVKAGSIIPMGDKHVDCSEDQVGKPIDIRVYPGKNASFTLYFDEGDNYNCENGEYSIIDICWDESKKILSLGDRKGSYKGMPETQVFFIDMLGGALPNGSDCVYNGSKTEIHLN